MSDAGETYTTKCGGSTGKRRADPKTGPPEGYFSFFFGMYLRKFKV